MVNSDGKIAAVDANTSLILTGVFEPCPQCASISMVNGGLMANRGGDHNLTTC
jgi:hypothetical protein